MQRYLPLPKDDLNLNKSDTSISLVVFFSSSNSQPLAQVVLSLAVLSWLVG